jgi:hypothetical protein
MHEQSPFQITQLKVLTEVSVFGCSLLDHPNEILLAKSAVEELREKYPECSVSNVMAEYMSPWKSHLLTAKLDPLIKLVAEKIKNASINFLNTDLTALNYELIVADCWCAIYETTNHTIPHSHFPSDFSAVIYLEMDSDSAPIIFNESLVINPASGTVIFFPGSLPHHVPATKSRRVIVAINYIKIPAMSQMESV